MKTKHATPRGQSLARLQRDVVSLRRALASLKSEQKQVRRQLDLLRVPATEARPPAPTKWRKGLWKKHTGKLSQAGADKILAAVEECCEQIDAEKWD